MLRRILERDIAQSLREFPIVGLIGSRQIGKTTLAHVLAGKRRSGAVFLDLERPSDLARLADAELYLSRHSPRLVVIDEIQRRPDLFPLLRTLVDADRRAGRFLILGSASPQMRRQSAESLAGRVVYHELAPLCAREVASADWPRLWVRGGYPESYLARSEARSLSWRTAFIRTYLERDLPQLGVRVPAAQLGRFWEMLAHCHGQLWNASAVASSLAVTAPTIRHYLDILQESFLVRQLQPWFPNLGKRLVKSPRIYLRDSGLLHALLRIATDEELRGHPIAGASWEGWALEQVMSRVRELAQPYFYRTHSGAEMDLVLVRGGRPAAAVEFKLSLSPQLTRGFHESLRDLGSPPAFVIYPGKDSYELGPGVETLPVTKLGRLETILCVPTDR